jgi:hypothetical protein
MSCGKRKSGTQLLDEREREREREREMLGPVHGEEYSLNERASFCRLGIEASQGEIDRGVV